MLKSPQLEHMALWSLVDVWLPDPGVQIRLAHLSKASVRSGDKILAGVEVIEL